MTWISNVICRGLFYFQVIIEMMGLLYVCMPHIQVRNVESIQLHYYNGLSFNRFNRLEFWGFVSQE